MQKQTNNIISSAALILSSISFAFSGFAAYQVFEQQKEFSAINSKLTELKNSTNNLATTVEQKVKNSELDTLTNNDPPK